MCGEAMSVCTSTVTTKPPKVERDKASANTSEVRAFSGIIAPDAAALEYLNGRRYAPDPLPDWSNLATDEGATFDREITIDATTIEPMVSWGTSPGQSVAVSGTIPADVDEKALTYIGLEVGQAIEP